MSNSNLKFKVKKKYFVHLQDGLKIIVHPWSDVSVDIVGCQIDLVLYDAESSSKGLDVNAGTVYAKNNVVYSNHVDPVGFAISTAKKVDLEMILIESTDETPRYLMKATLANFLFCRDVKLSFLPVR